MVTQTTHASTSYTDLHSDRGILTSDCLRYLPHPLDAAVLA